MVVRRCTRRACPPRARAPARRGRGGRGAGRATRGVHTIAFTGSGPVGLEIIRAAAEPPGARQSSASSPRWAARTASSSTPTPTSTRPSPRSSRAFGYAGQKCSAASRVLVHEAIADALLERLAGAVEVLASGQADNFGTDVPPRHRARGPGARRALPRCARERRAHRRRARATACPATAGSSRPPWPPTCPAESPVPARRSSARCWPSSACATSTRPCDRVDDLPFALTGGLFAATRHRRARRAPLAGRQPLRQPPDHRRHGRAPAVRRQRLRAPARRPAAPITCRVRRAGVVTENTVRHGFVI